MAKVIYTTVPRVINGKYINANPENPAKVEFGLGPDGKPFDPLGRVTKIKGKRIETIEVEREIEVTSPKGERFKTKVKVGVPHEVEEEIEKYVAFTKSELGAQGLIVVEEGDPAPAQKLKPAHAETVAGTPAAHTRDKDPGARPSDREPAK